MSRRPEEIRREIEMTRGQLAQNLEAIGDKVSPKHVLEEVADKVSPRRILNRQTEKMKDSLSSVGDSVLGRAADTANGVRSTVGSATGSARGALNGVGGTASEAADGARQGVSSIGDRVRSVSSSATDQLKAAPDSNPMATALVAFGAGLLVGLALPPTQKEREAAGTVHDKVVEPVKQQAVQAGKSVAGELQPATEAKVQRVKRTATTARERVKAEAKGVTADVKGQAAGAAETVKGQARRAAKTTQSQARAAAKTTTTEARTTARRTAGQVRQKAGA